MKLLVIVTAIMTLPASTLFAANSPVFGDDIGFLKQHTDVLVLSASDGLAKIAVVPAWQGRVMTSTAAGDSGASFGWLNRGLIQSGKLLPHINVFGGEDRFWLGPEGGQFALFFAKGVPFDLEHWFTPAPLDTMPYPVVSHTSDSARFAAHFALTNFSGTRFDVAVDRLVQVLEPGAAWKDLGLEPDAGVKLVGYETRNQITNAGQIAWKKDTGLLSIWILGQFNASPGTTIVVPIKPGPESELGVKVTSDYFGAIPPDRLAVKDRVVYLKADSHFRSKIGINPRRSRRVLGSFDADHGVLTIVQFSQPEGVTDYVNSLWKLQDNPYGGDAANSYNDGPPAPGAKGLGAFYELESSSPAAALAPGATISHLHRTIHLTGPDPALDRIARSVLGVSLHDIRHAFQP